MADVIAAHDWSTTKLGPLDSWPQSLRTSVGMMINNHEPKFLLWGRDYLTIHNDAYLPFVKTGLRHGIGESYPEVSPHLWPTIAPLLEEAMEGRGTSIENLPVRRIHAGSEETAYFIFSSSPAFDENDKVAGVKAVLLEITPTVLDNRSIERERDRLRELLEQAPGFVGMSRGPEHRIEFVNAAFRELLGSRDFVGRPSAEAIPELEREGLLTLLDEVYATGIAYIARGRRVLLQRRANADPEERLVDFIYQPVRDSQGQVQGIFLQGNDVTEQIRAQEQVQLLQNNLIHLSRVSAMGTMASALAHELNQPLAAAAAFVAGAGKLLDRRDDQSKELVRTGLSRAEESIIRAGNVIRRMRAMIGRKEVTTQRSDVSDLIHEISALALLGAHETGISVEYDLEPGLAIDVDRTQIQQVILNLVRNALEAIAEAPVRIVAISARRTGSMVEVRISDTGAGIAPELRTTLFDAFVSSKQGGMGVGLSISRTIIEAHDGKLGVDSRPGSGASFWFTLPAAE
ncbi:MAG: hypothetical protein JWN69_1241 [Alphaproteobacteria bacterium]|nr:hypothetical protein [Alphaproteobacteria bacterium]